jgi:hypothetical protein
VESGDGEANKDDSGEKPPRGAPVESGDEKGMDSARRVSIERGNAAEAEGTCAIAVAIIAIVARTQVMMILKRLRDRCVVGLVV